MANYHNLFTNCVGRYVSGDHASKRTKDSDGKFIEEDKQRYEFGVAFNKTDPDMARIFGEINTFLRQEWAASPAHIQALDNWFLTFQGLSMKISDGDAPNSEGKVNENTVGCFVFWFSSLSQPKCSNTDNVEISPEAIKRGYYVQVAFSIAINGRPANSKAGMYLNGDVIRLIAEGDVIGGGADVSTAFNGATVPTQLPPGARPVGTDVGLPGVTPGAPPQPAATGLPGTTPVQQAAPATAPPQQVGPAGNGSATTALPGNVATSSQQAPQQAVPTQTASPTNQPTPHTGILTGPAGVLPGAQ